MFNNNMQYNKILSVCPLSFFQKLFVSFSGNGGWGDKRDQLMCLNMSTFNSTLLHEQLGESFGL